MEFPTVVTLRGALAIPPVADELAADEAARVHWEVLLTWLTSWSLRHHDNPHTHRDKTRGECVWCQKAIQRCGPMPHPVLMGLFSRGKPNDFALSDGRHSITWLLSAERVREMSERRKVFQRMAPQLAAQVFARDGYRCLECGASGEGVKFHPDHIVPIAEGGTDDLSNLRTLCVPCNLRKAGYEGQRGRRRMEDAARRAVHAALYGALQDLGVVA